MKGQKLVRDAMKRLRDVIHALPENKQMRAQINVQQLIEKNSGNIGDEQGLQHLSQLLDNKASFYQLAYPDIKIVESTHEEAEEDFNLSFYLVKPPTNATVNQQQEQQQEQELGTTYYKMEDGKVKEGRSKPRSSTDLSNWFAGNVDPEDMVKHRELLDRQHYRGPQWKGKQVKSVLDTPHQWGKGNHHETQDLSTKQEKLLMQHRINNQDHSFEKVNR